MKLFHSPTSPFVRKVLVTAHETGLIGQIEQVSVGTTPLQSNADLVAANPVGKLPTLVLDDGTALHDSRVIVEYLDALAGSIVIPPNGPARWTALRRQAAADGLLDAAVLIRYEYAFRPEASRFPAWIDAQFDKIGRILDALEAEADHLGPTTSIGEIAIGCALGFIDFRFPDDDWRAARPGLATFHAGFSERASMVATRPVG